MTRLKSYIALDNPFRLLYHKIRAIFANILYMFPSKKMIIIGVTGTNGKTTTSNIIAKGLKKAGKKVFMFTTVNIIIGDKDYTNNSKMTSPDAFELQKLLKIAKNAGCEIAVIETASHGIKMNRVWGLDYDIVVLTNITQDHLDLHRTMDDYVNTKLRIFKNLIRYKRKPGVKKTAIVNKDSDYSELFLNETYDNLYTYGKNIDSNLSAKNIKTSLAGTTFDVKIPGEIFKIKTKLIGDFNVYNILAAIGVFVNFAIKKAEIEEIIRDIDSVPGRMEEIENKEDIKIFVDYAHTPDAIEKVLETIKNIDGISRIICVFGATGDRDKTKRPIMGEIVSRLSDVVVLTQDDDYTEKPYDIIKDVFVGIERKEGDDFWIIVDRKEAIRTALVTAKKNDVVVVLGKGDEHSMITNDGPVEWHDRAVIEEILKDLDDNKLIK